MEYNLDVDRWVTVEIITGSTLKASQAKEEGSRYQYAKIPDSHYWICEDPEKTTKDGEKGALYIVLCHDGKLGCTCEHFAKHGDKCEHLYRAMELKPDDLKTAEPVVISLLENDGWTVIDEVFTPPTPGSKKVTVEVVAELPPIDEEPVDPPAKKPLCVATCQYCELEIKAATQESADKRRDNHEKVCKKRPAESSKAEAPKQTKEAPAKKEKPPAEKPKPKEPETPIDPLDEPPQRKPHPTPTAVAEDVQDETQPIDEVGEITSSQVQEIIPVAIAKALCNMQKTELFAATDSTNTFFNNSKYADLASIWRAIRAPLTDSGLAIMQTTEPYPNGITVVTTMMHVSGASYTTRLSGAYPGTLDKKTGKPKPQTVQALGSLITYLRRYSLAALVGVASADDDGEEASGRPPQNKR